MEQVHDGMGVGAFHWRRFGGEFENMGVYALFMSRVKTLKVVPYGRVVETITNRS